MKKHPKRIKIRPFIDNIFPLHGEACLIRRKRDDYTTIFHLANKGWIRRIEGVTTNFDTSSRSITKRPSPIFLKIQPFHRG